LLQVGFGPLLAASIASGDTGGEGVASSTRIACAKSAP
jgi:hypothetical protein